MKSGLVTSAALHAVLLSYGLWAMSSPKSLDATYAEALPVEIVMSDTFQGVEGESDAPITEKPAPTPTTRPETLPMPAENVGENEADLDTPPVPDVKPNDAEPTPAPKAAEAPPPEPEPVPVEPEVAEIPPPPEPAPTPEPVPAETPQAEPDPVEQAIEQAAAESAPAPDPVPRNVPVPQAKPRPPRPVEVAEAKKPEPPKKPATEVRPKPDATEVAKAPSEEPSEFNTDDIAALLTKEKAAGGGARRSTEQASLGSKKTTGSTLSRSQLGQIQGLLNEQMARCYSVPSGALDAEELKVSIHIEFDPSGGLVGTPTIVRGGDGSSRARIASEAAVRAIRRCAPFNLPAELYSGGWESTTLNFDPSAMF